MKLKNFAKPFIIEKYKTLAKTLLNRKNVSREELKQAVQDISGIEDEINKFLTLEI